VKRVLLVKTSSLGDVVHNLPVASDLVRAFPGVRIDWAVEPAFAALPRLHPAVHRVIPVALRRWRREIWRPATLSDMMRARAELRQERYDAVIDTQGLLKSAVVAAQARGPKYGLDRASSREPLGMFYDRTFRVPWGQHAVARNRQLASLACRYDLPTACSYGVHALPAKPEWIDDVRYCVLLHATSAPAKLWDEERWVGLGEELARRGWWCVLPWGSEEEKERSERIAEVVTHAIVPPALALETFTGLLAGAQVVVGVDTGLTHLAGAVGAPTVGVYTATDPAATGLFRCARGVNVGGIGAQPGVAEVTAALDKVLG